MQEVKKKIILELRKVFPSVSSSRKISIKQKEDKSFVTELDYFVSDLIKKSLLDQKKYDSYSFFSEEDHTDLKFPSIILDPIDGTHELIKEIGEIGLSLAIMNSPEIRSQDHFAWIYNPCTGMDLHTNQPFYPAKNCFLGKRYGAVSRSEWSKGYYANLESESLGFFPRGSIAFKLSLLASGGVDFVLSLRPKNIWDIAAGTILCSQRNFSFYESGKKVTHLKKK